MVKAIFQYIDHMTKEDMSNKHEKIVKNILKILQNQPGLIANIIFNLNQPNNDDPEVLGYQISLVGNMCYHLRSFQRSKYMIESGTHNLRYIMTQMNNLEFQKRATIAIRKATSCRVLQLLDAFVADGIIEALHKILHDFGDAALERIEKKSRDTRTKQENIMREIQINCQCIIVHLSYRAQNVRRIERIGAMKYISSFEKMSF